MMEQGLGSAVVYAAHVVDDLLDASLGGLASGVHAVVAGVELLLECRTLLRRGALLLQQAKQAHQCAF